jgi:S1-C subfamily serine protease
MTRLARVSAAAVLLACVGLALVPVAANAEPAPQQALTFKQLTDARANTLVTIKFILKSPEGEEESEATGVLISGDGLVLSSNFAFGGGPFGGTSTPTDIKVLVGEDTTGVDAKFIARDTELGLAWIKVDTAPSTPYAYVDFKDSTEVTQGDALLSVQKMGKFFGLATTVSEGHVGAVVTKPRTLVIPTIGMAGGELAVPIYNTAGKVVGISTYILPEAEEMQNARQSMRGSEFGMILPAADVVTATANAMEQAKNAPPAADAAPEAKPAGATPAPDEAPR